MGAVEKVHAPRSRMEIIEELESKDWPSCQTNPGDDPVIIGRKNFLHNFDFMCLKCGSLPAKADLDRSVDSIDVTEKHIMERAKKVAL